MRSVDPSRLTPSERRRLLALARAAIAHGLSADAPLPVALADWPVALTAPGAAFVTLYRRGQLRGCIGSLEARQPLVRDVADNAQAAAFRDPRFMPVEIEELATLVIQISVLTPAEPIPCASRQELLAHLRPGIDGAILDAGDGRRGTFLPVVWEQLPEPASFLRQLQRKAGLETDDWPVDLRAWRYQSECFGESPESAPPR